MKKYIAIVFVLAILAGCTNDTITGDNKSLVLKEKVELQVGECVSGNNQLSLCVDSVFSDSRCPLDVNCVWEGNAAVALTFTLNDKTHQLTLNTNNSKAFPSDTTIGQYLISLSDLKPYPVSVQAIEQNDYRISLLVDELQD